jgi:hypothetical protein
LCIASEEGDSAERRARLAELTIDEIGRFFRQRSIVLSNLRINVDLCSVAQPLYSVCRRKEDSDGVPLESLISNLAGTTDKARNAAQVGRDNRMANGGTAWGGGGLSTA